MRSNIVPSMCFIAHCLVATSPAPAQTFEDPNGCIEVLDGGCPGDTLPETVTEFVSKMDEWIEEMTAPGEYYKTAKKAVDSIAESIRKEKERERKEKEEAEARKPVVCYELLRVISGYVTKQGTFCAKDGLERCHAEGRRVVNRYECKFVSSKTPDQPTQQPTTSSECYVLVWHPGAGLMPSERGDFCGSDSRNQCYREADRRNAETPTGRYGCKLK